jgi:hypothetical protein
MSSAPSAKLKNDPSTGGNVGKFHRHQWHRPATETEYRTVSQAQGSVRNSAVEEQAVSTPVTHVFRVNVTTASLVFE